MKKFGLLKGKLISIICISIYIVNTPSFAVSNFPVDSNPENSRNVSKELMWYPTSDSSSLSTNQVTLNLPINPNRESRSKKNSEKNRNLNDLIQEASSKVEKRNKKVNRNSSQQKSRATTKSSSSKNRQNSKLYRSGSQSSKYNNRDYNRYNNNNNLRLNVLPYSAYQQRLFYRGNPARDSNRPVKIVNPKIFFYDFDDYYDYYDDRNKIRAGYDSREDYASKESLEDVDDKDDVEETTTEEDNMTTTESTTTAKNENATTPGFHGYGYGYGPPHGHEHVSFTYGPNWNDNYWHGQQQFSDTFNPNPYLTHFKK